MTRDPAAAAEALIQAYNAKDFDAMAAMIAPDLDFALMQALIERPGTILSRAQLEDRLYRWGDEVESNAVEVHIHGLRKKLGAEYIRNVRGVGWYVPRTP